MKAKLASVTLGGDITRYGLAILFATAFGAVQVFAIPRRLDIVTYGQYRLFLLCVGYIGVLHFGLADGAFLRWAGWPMSAIRHEARRVADWILAISLALVCIGIGAASLTSDPLQRTFLVALGAAALTMNAASLAGYALQAGADFRGAGRVVALGPGLFALAMVALPIHTLRAALAAYVGSFAVAAVVGAVHIAGHTADGAAAPQEPLHFKTLIRRGLAVLGANLAASQSQFADRILVGIVVPVTTFALYGFASSVMMTANAATQALSRVALAHAARQPAEGGARAVFLGGFYDLIAAGFGLAMAGVPLFEHVVGLSLPAYATAIPIVRALVIGAPFWVAIHVVLVGTLQSHGMVRRQFIIEIAGLALVVVICGACLAAGAALTVVAAGNTAAAIVTWIGGIFVLRRAVPGADAQPIGRFMPIILVQIAAIVGVLAIPAGWVVQSVVYAAIAAVPTFIAARAAKQHGW